MNRRAFLSGLVAAPAVIRVAPLMRIVPVPLYGVGPIMRVFPAGDFEFRPGLIRYVTAPSFEFLGRPVSRSRAIRQVFTSELPSPLA